MKKLVVAIMFCSLVVPAFGQKKPAEKPVALTCAVMKEDKVDAKKATKAGLFSDYKGRRYYFCCANCKPTFDKSPEKYKDAPSVPTPKKKA